MVWFMPFFFGLFAAAIGILPPGLINMTAAKISLKDGKTRALMFVFGALIVIFFQTLVALIFARYIDGHKHISLLLREVGFVVFSLLTIYFLWIAKKPGKKIQDDIKVKSKKSRFFLGIVISAINFFPIPYYVFVSVTLAGFGYFRFDEVSIYSFTTGVVFGSFFVFYGYINFFKNLESKTTFISKNINIIIGSITGFVALMSLIYIIKNY
jgi:threonine/homoserine/homoserine lactone efflux protein